MTYTFTLYPDQSGHVSSELGDFPIYAGECSLARASQEVIDYISEDHWHNDLELVYVKSGSFDIIISGNRVHLDNGQAVFINSGRMHSFDASDKECRYITVRINPQIFTRNFEIGTAYFDRKFGSTNIDYMFLDPDVDWQGEIIRQIVDLAKKQKSVDSKPLTSISSALKMLENLGSHIPDSNQAAVNKNDYDCFMAMTQYIRDHISEKIQIEDIAHSGHVSRAKVYTLFYNFASQSPNTYLMTARVEKSANMLRGTNLSIGDIAILCGFRTPSYFASVFRKEKGLTPREYRTKYQ